MSKYVRLVSNGGNAFNSKEINDEADEMNRTVDEGASETTDNQRHPVHLDSASGDPQAVLETRVVDSNLRSPSWKPRSDGRQR